MGYEAAPPTGYTEPTLLPLANRPQRMWGDAESGRVLDTIYVSNDWVHLVKFTLEPGAGWRDSTDYKTYFSAEVVYYILSGELFVADVSTGEVSLVRAGEALHVPPETWHHGFNKGVEPLEMVEFIAPPPVTGSTRGFYKDIPLPEQFRTSSRQPTGVTTIRLRLIRPDEQIWRLEGESARTPVAVVASTDNLTVGVGRLGPGVESGERNHRGGLVLYVLRGSVTLTLSAEPKVQYALNRADGFFVPPGAGYHLGNAEEDQAEWLFEVAPTYHAP